MERRTITQVAEGALGELEKLGYTRISVIHFRQAFARVERFAAQIGAVFLSDDLTKSYLLCNYNWDTNSNAPPSAHTQSQLRAIRVLECYERNGSVPGRYAQPKEPPDCFKRDYELYLSDCARRGLSDATMASRSSDICNLLVDAQNNGITTVADLDVKLLDEHLSLCSQKSPKAMARVLSSLRCFLRYLFANSITEKDLSFLLPSALIRQSRSRNSGVKKKSRHFLNVWTGRILSVSETTRLSYLQPDMASVREIYSISDYAM